MGSLLPTGAPPVVLCQKRSTGRSQINFTEAVIVRERQHKYTAVQIVIKSSEKRGQRFRRQQVKRSVWMGANREKQAGSKQRD